MRTFRLARVILILFLASLPTSAQQTPSTSSPSPTSDPQAVALIQKSLTALTNGTLVTDVTLTGTAHRIAGSDDETGTGTLTATALGDSKVALSFPSGNRTEIRNHSAIPLPGSFASVDGLAAPPTQTALPVGAWSGPDGAMHGMAAHNFLTDPTWFFPALTLARLTNPPYVLSYVGVEPFNGTQAIHVTAAQRVAPTLNGQAPFELPPLTQHLSQIDFYFDSSTLLPLAIAFNEHPDTNALADIPVEVQFSSYQAVQGAQVPRHVQRFINNGLVLDLQIDSAVLNSGLSASTFQLQ